MVFAGAVLLWLFNSLANVIRGTGNMAVPAVVTCVGAVLADPVVVRADLRLGAVPRLGIAGGAVAVIALLRAGSWRLRRICGRGAV